MKKREKTKVQVFIQLFALIAAVIMLAIFTGCPAPTTSPDPVDESVPVTGVFLNKAAATITVGSTELLTAVLTPADATNTGMAWTSSSSSVATVNSDGLVTGVSDGSAVITVRTSSGGFTATCTVTIETPVTGVSLNKASTTILNGGSEQLTATISPSDATDPGISWTSDNESVATVTDGLVEGVGDGSATIKVTTADGAFTASCDITITSVSELVTGISLDITSTTINITETAQLTETIAPAGATNQNVTWTSDDNTIATVSSSGLITAVAGGTTVITVTSVDGSFTDTCTLTVLEAVTGITLDITSTTINATETVQLTATISPASATNQNVTWTSSDGTIATVSSSGLVTGIDFSGGNAAITVTTEDGGFSATCNVTVIIPVTEVSIERYANPVDEVEVNSLFEDYYIDFLPWNATNQNYTISSSAPAVASIITGSGGWVDITGVSIGTSTITVTSEDGGFTDSFVLTVVADAIAPEPDGSMFFSATQILVAFSEAVTQATAEATANYVISDQTGNTATVISAVLESSSIVYLTLNETLIDGDTLTLTVSNIEDPTGNTCVSTPFPMTFTAQPSPLNVSNIVVSGSTITGSPGAGDSGTWQGGSPTLNVFVFTSGVMPAEDTLLGMSIIMNDGSFAAIADPDSWDDIIFSSGNYDLYVLSELTGGWSSAVTITVP